MIKITLIKLFKNKKLVLKISLLIPVLILLLPQSLNSQFQNSNPNHIDKLVLLKNEFNNFLNKYKSNSCIMNIFSDFNNQCENLNDSETSKLSFKLTMCVYASLNKKINFTCNIENPLSCIKFLEGDLWTTYITFSHHIDNLCQYHKTLLWEKSTEFLFVKLMNSSMNVLSELSESSNLAQKMFNTQEKFSIQIEQNLTNTLNHFQNINQFFENYTKIEEKLKENILMLENKINNNNEKMGDVVKYIDDKLQVLKLFYEFFNTNSNYSSNALYYFLTLFSFTWFVTFAFKSLKGVRIILNILLIFFFLFEKFVLTSIYSNYNYYDFSFIYFNLIFYACRVIYCLIIILLISIRIYYFRPKENNELKNNYPNNNSSREIWSDYKSLLSMTPLWMKKYFTKLKMQNEYLIEKFQKMKELLEKEKANLIYQNENNHSFNLYSE